jgi:tetraacyldisaccharide 4'-kinase
MPVQAWLNRLWYGPPQPPAWLRPFAALYGAVVALRHHAYRAGWRRSAPLDCPVVVVGNLTVGGTGKTPLVIWLSLALQERGRRPGIVTRGYGGRARGARLVSAVDGSAQVGDEALLMARRTALPVAVGRDRPAAARLLVAAGCDVIVSDDGLQHLPLPRACEIVVIDAARGFGNGALLPAGPLREPIGRLDRIDALVTNGQRAGGTAGFTMRLQPRAAIALQDGAARPLAGFAGQAVHAIAGIGNPGRFFSMLESCGITVIPHPRDDHAPVHAADVDFGDDLPVLMTEKDAVKCAGLDPARLWAVPVDAGFSAAEAAALLAIVAERIGRGNRNADEE